MKTTLAIMMTCLFFCAQTNAATMDLTDMDFNILVPGTVGPNSFSETAGGVVFTFTAVDNFVGGPEFRNYGNGNGLQLGGGGGTTIEFTLSASQDVELTQYSFNDAGGFPLGNAEFDIIDGMTTLSAGNSLDSMMMGTVAFNSAPVSMTAGTDYTFDINNFGAAVQGFITSVEFNVVPEPSSLVFLLAGLFGLWGLRR